jgi:uncharacterized protein (DUF736 family)
MNIIGNFTQDGEVFTGSIQTLAFSGPVTLEPVVEKVSENSPDLRMYTTRTRSNGRVQIGAGWKERSEGGKPYIGVRLDDPSFPAPISCRLIQLDGQDGYSLIWSRS